MNASRPGNNIFFMGVAGGPQCGGNRCSYTPGTKIITWAFGQNDQLWSQTFPGGPQHVVNLFGSPVSGQGFCLHVAGNPVSNNANLVINPCTTSMSDNWTLQSAESLGAPFSGCFIFRNQLSQKVMAVKNGNVGLGAEVIQFDLCQPGSPACGNPPNAFHADQFWCPLS